MQLDCVGLRQSRHLAPDPVPLQNDLIVALDAGFRIDDTGLHHFQQECHAAVAVSSGRRPRRGPSLQTRDPDLQRPVGVLARMKSPSLMCGHMTRVSTIVSQVTARVRHFG